MGLFGWSVVEAGQTFLFGYALAHALDQGFLRGRQGVGLWWLALAAVAVPVGAYGTARVFGAVAALVEPVRDRLVRHVVRGGLATAVRAAARGGGRPADSAVVSRLTHQVEIARDSLGGIVMVLRSFAFTAAGVVAGMIALAPVLLLVVLPPLVAGTALFTLALRPLARRQRDFLAADEAVAEECGALAGGLRDITACGAQRPMAERADRRIADALRASRALATWGVTRTLALAVAGQLPLVLLLTASPWLLSTHRLTPGALLGALAYLTQSLQPALQSLLHTLTTSGTRLTVVLTRLTSPSADTAPAGAEPAVAGPMPAVRPGPDGPAPRGGLGAGRGAPSAAVRVSPRRRGRCSLPGRVG
ncbi:ABC transporter transmembrane domain-containing protein [Actinacidiphila bryophytorum]|uniref:ABC transporter transmembrane domain-containing protein n=1 Tax=Actinacidiphila bryophytorum TaxID=1436133 RepID=UPI002B00010A|nr:ABC transporter transmembrane domain-containing protein [Actinacidiphila bryophytorum]